MDDDFRTRSLSAGVRAFHEASTGNIVGVYPSAFPDSRSLFSRLDPDISDGVGRRTLEVVMMRKVQLESELRTV